MSTISRMLLRKRRGEKARTQREDLQQPSTYMTAPQQSPPVFNDLAQIYSSTNIEVAKQRYQTIKNKFNTVYGAFPEYFVRSPGRVNLIGEHIDYNGYPVLPFALEQDVVIAVRVDPSSQTLRINNVDDKFPAREVDITNIVVDGSSHNWANYFLAAHKGITENNPAVPARGMSVMVHGTVLQGAGLSSSSAFVCASAVAIARALGENLSKNELARIATTCERYIGMEGGGMDQAISLLAQHGTAKLIEFNPLTTFDVNLPAGSAFVICSSLVDSTKYLTAGTNYNMRVLECKLGTAIMAKSLGLAWQTIRKPKELEIASKKSLAQLQQIASEVLGEAYNKADVAEILGMGIPELEAQYFTSRVKVVGTEFRLRSRMEHVYSEANRVYGFRDVCAKATTPQQMEDLGTLMNDSHCSCSRDYECSCPELDELTSICRRAGALGSRLTGAGWGGCTISLVPSAKVPAFFDIVYKEYYAKLPIAHSLRTEEYMFSTCPGTGAAIYIE